MCWMWTVIELSSVKSRLNIEPEIYKIIKTKYFKKVDQIKKASVMLAYLIKNTIKF